MRLRTLQALTILAILIVAPMVAAHDAPASSHMDAKDHQALTTSLPVLLQSPLIPRAVGNKTEYMGNATTPPDIDGNLTPGEWDNAVVYQIGVQGKDVRMLIMYNATKIFIAFDVVSDTTNDTADPGAMSLINPQGDYFMVGIDGENDGKLTYGSIDQGGNNWPSTYPLTEGGNCTDRWAISHGGKSRYAGFVETNKDKTGPMFYYWTGPGANTGTGEPFDWLNPGFKTHRTFEYSIPYSGPIGFGYQNELNRSYGKKIGIVALVNDGSTQNIIGRMPWNATSAGIGPPWQEFMIKGKPHAKMNPPSKTKILAGDTISFSDGGSTDPDGLGLSYAWDFSYDGVNFINDTQGQSVSHKFDVPGNYTVGLRVMDSYGAQDTATANIIVVAPELPPVLSNLAPTQTYSLAENNKVTFKANYSDGNLAQTGEMLHLEWSINGKVVKSFNTAKNGTTSQMLKTNYTGNYTAGTYKIKVTVTDSYNAQGFYTGAPQTASFEWTLSVTNVNLRPVITSWSPLDLNATTINVVTPLNFSITKFDPDGDAMAVSWFVDNVVQAGATSDSFEYLKVPDYTASGPHSIKVVIKDLGTPIVQVQLIWNITVAKINRGPKIMVTNPSAGRLSMDAGTVKEFQVGASDPDGDTVTYQWFFNGDPMENETSTTYFFSPDYTMASQTEYEIKVTVSDGNITIPIVWNVLVKDVDRPFITEITTPKDGTHYKLSSVINFDASGSHDPDNDPLSYLWNFGDGNTKAVAKTTHKYIAPGTYKVTLIMTSTHKDKSLTKTSYMNLTIDASVLNIIKVTIDQSQVKKGANVQIDVMVMNNGTLRADNITIDLLLDNGAVVGSESKVTVETGTAKHLIFIWIANTDGKHFFNAKIRMDNSADTVFVNSQMSSGTITVKSQTSNHVSNDMTMLLVVLLLVIVVIMVIIVLFVRSKRKPKVQVEQPTAATTKAYEPVAPTYHAPVQQVQHPPVINATPYEPAQTVYNPPVQHVQRPPPPPPPPRPVEHRPVAPPPPPPPKPVVYKPLVPPPAAKGSDDELTDEEAAALEAELEKDMAQPAAPAKPAQVKPTPPPLSPALPKAQPPRVVKKTVKSGVPSMGGKDVSIRKDVRSTSIAGDGLAVTDEMAQMAAEAGLCPSCGGTVSAEDTNCPSCNQKLVLPSWLKEKRNKELDSTRAAKLKASEGKCPKCGYDIDPDFKRCPSCGKDL